MFQNKNKKIIFLHIPKTAGNTFRSLLSNIDKNDNIGIYHSGAKGIIPEFKEEFFNHLISKTQKKIEIYNGHFVYSSFCLDADVYTFVRDVHETFFSNLYYFYLKIFRHEEKNVKNIEYIHQNFEIDLRLSLSDSITIEKLIKMNFLTSNPFIKTIAGIPYEKYFYIKEDIKIDEKIYEQALKNIKLFSGVINTKNLNPFINNFLKKYNLQAKQYTSKNISNYDRNFIKSISNLMYEQIIDYNKYDYKLLRELDFIHNQ